MEEPGTRKHIVDLSVIVDGTGDLIEGGEKNAKEDVETRETASITNAPG